MRRTQAQGLLGAPQESSSPLPPSSVPLICYPIQAIVGEKGTVCGPDEASAIGDLEFTSAPWLQGCGGLGPSAGGLAAPRLL